MLHPKEIFVWLENPLQIKLSSGIQRSKTDRLDARMIAEYACRHRDKAKGCTLPDKGLKIAGTPSDKKNAEGM